VRREKNKTEKKLARQNLCWEALEKYSQTWVIRIWVVRNLGLYEFFARSRRNPLLYIESLSCTKVWVIRMFSAVPCDSYNPGLTVYKVQVSFLNSLPLLIFHSYEFLLDRWNFISIFLDLCGITYTLFSFFPSVPVRTANRKYLTCWCKVEVATVWFWVSFCKVSWMDVFFVVVGSAWIMY